MISKPSNPKLTPDDVDVMAAILADYPELHWTRTMLEDSLKTPSCRVFYHSAVSFAVFQTVGNEAELLLVASRKDQQGRGHATRLLKDALTQLATQEVHHIFLEVRSSNQLAQHLYEKLGFVQTGRRCDYYQNPLEDAILYKNK